MAKKKSGNWIQGAIKHPGSFTNKAKKHHESTSEYANDVISGKTKASTQTKKQANLSKTLSKMRKKKSK